MKTPETELPRRTGLGRMAVGALVAVGVALAAASPAMADNWKHGNGHGNKHWKKQQHYEYSHGNKHRKKQQHYEYSHGGYYYQPRPKVVYVQPAPVYVAPPPPVYYYQPAPVYHRPQVSIVFPLNF